jgi:cobalamin biosynthesis Mg chelatase CobN
MRSNSKFARTAALAVAAAALALPGQALAQYYIPPSNSAANQYKESFPSAGGDTTGGSGKRGVTPGQALGARNAHRLESQGPAGKAAAELAAATAPGPVSATAGAANPQGGSGAATQGGSTAGTPGSGNGSTPATAKATGSAGGGPSTSGASAVSSALGQATGASNDGSLGLWLPILIVATIAVSLGYRLRMRSGSHHGSTA